MFSQAEIHPVTNNTKYHQQDNNAFKSSCNTFKQVPIWGCNHKSICLKHYYFSDCSSKWALNHTSSTQLNRILITPLIHMKVDSIRSHIQLHPKSDSMYLIRVSLPKSSTCLRSVTCHVKARKRYQNNRTSKQERKVNK